MKKSMKELMIAVEEEEAIINKEVPETVEEIQLDPAVVEQDLTNEVLPLSDEIVVLSDAISDNSCEVENLDKVACILNTEDSDELDETAAEIAAVAIENILERLKISSASYSLENFNDKLPKRVALETVSDVLTRVLTAIRTALSKLLDYVKNFFSKLFDANLKVLKQAEHLRKKISEMSDEEFGSKGEKFESELVSRAFGGKDVDVNSVKDTVKIHTKFTEAGNELFKKAVDLVDDLDKMLANTNASSILGKVSDVSRKAEKLFMDATHNTGFSKTVMAENGAEIRIGPFVNSIGMTITMADNPKRKNGLPIFSIRENVEKPAENLSVKSLDKKTALDVLDQAISLCELNVTYKEKFPAFEKMFKASIELIDGVLKSITKMADSASNGNSESSDTLKEVGVFVQSLSQTLSKFASRIPTHNVTCVLAIISYVKHSISAKEAESK